MGYIVCDNCGGYYELQQGESAEDFDTCQCGGNLNFSNTVPENNDIDNTKSNPSSDKKSVMICPHCLKYHDSSIFCSKCGSDLISVEKGNGYLNKNFNSVSSSTSRKNTRIPKRVPKRYPKKIPRNYSPSPDSAKEYHDYEDSGGLKSILNRISWKAVIIGVIFFVFASFIFAFVIFIVAASQMVSESNNMYYYPDSLFLFTAIILLLVLGLVSIISGALTAYISKKWDYTDGALNGFVVGLAAVAVLVGSGDSAMASIIGVSVCGVLAAVGGLLGIFIRRKLSG